MKTGVDLVCQREQNSHSRDFLRKLPVLEMSSSHAYPLYFYCSGASAVFQHSTILSTSVLQSEVVQVLYKVIYSLYFSIHLLFVSVHSNLFYERQHFQGG